MIPPNNVHNVATLLTPEYDHTTIFYFIAWNGADKPGIGADAWRKFNVLAENKLDDGFMASPAVAGKALFVRSKTHLYRLEK